MLPDPKSLVLIGGLLSFLCTVVLFSQRKNAPSTIRGIGEWALACSAATLAGFFYSQQTAIPPFWGYVVPNTLLAFASTTFTLGTRRFYGEQASFLPIAGLSAAVALYIAYFTYIDNQFVFRTGLMTTIQCATSFHMLVVLRRHSRHTFSERLLSAVFIFLLIATALRLADLLLRSDGKEHLLSATLAQRLYLSALALGVLSVSVGFILLVNDRIRRELEKLATDLQSTSSELEAQIAAKTKVLAYAGHDLRQPLQAIRLFNASLQNTELNRDQRHLVQMVGSSASALGELLDDLLDLAKLDAGAVAPIYQPLDLDVLLAHLIQEFTPQAKAHNLDLRLRLPNVPVTVYTDEGLLCSVLRNLLSNAIKYTPQGGVLIGIRVRNREALLQVWDTGIGIAAEQMDHIFEEFYQVDNKERDRARGLGLGLSICRRIDRLMGLRLNCQSRPGKGTVMSLRLPLAQESATSCAQSRPSLPVNLAHWRIAVIEDAVEVRASLARWLESLGARVILHASAEHALADAELPSAHFVLTDYRLPGAIDGIDLLTRLKQRMGDRMAGAILTGDTSPAFIEMATASGWPILFKPIDPEKLSQVLMDSRLSGQTVDSFQ